MVSGGKGRCVGPTRVTTLWVIFESLWVCQTTACYHIANYLLTACLLCANCYRSACVSLKKSASHKNRFEMLVRTISNKTDVI